MAQENGFSYGGPAGTAFALADPVPGQVKDATVQGYEFVLRTAVATATITRSANTKAAFESSTKLVVANMVRSFSKRLEAMLLYGQTNIGVVASTPTATTLTIAAADWASGLWSGAVNMKIDIYSADGLTARGTFQITAIDIDNKTLTVSTSLTGAGVIATDQIVHAGAGVQNGGTSLEFPGLQRIMTNTGTLFGISSSQYDLWKSTNFSAGNADLSFQKLQKAIAKAIPKGLDSDVKVHVCPLTWAKLNSDQAALRVYDKSYSSTEFENGAHGIKFYGQQGIIEIVSNIYVKESLAFVYPKGVLMRVGSTDVTFKRPGREDEFFRDLENNSGVELRAYTDQSLFCHAPGQLVFINQITNS